MHDLPCKGTQTFLFSKFLKAHHRIEGLASHLLNIRRSKEKDAVAHLPSLMHSDVELDLTEYLGRGPSGTVFKCKFLGVPAAAKVFDGTDTQLVKAVEAEVEIFASLQHPNVVRFIEYAIKGTQHILLSELKNTDLFKYLKEQGRTDIDQNIKIGARPILPSKPGFPSYLSAFIERSWATRAEDRPKFPEICQMLVHCKGALLTHVHPWRLKCTNEHDAHKLSCALGLQKCLQESLKENLPIQVYSLIVQDAFHKQNLDNVEQYIGCADWIKLQLKVGKHISNWIDYQADFEQAFELFSSAAEHDNPEALFSIGLCFELGLGREQNHEEAIQCYRAAIKLEDATCAYVGLGCCYALGHGVPPNDKEVNEMFQFAVEKKNRLENLLPCMSEMLHCLSQIPNVSWTEGYIGARINLKIKLEHHAKDPRGTPLLESIQYMLKHFPGTPDTIPEEEEGYKRAVCRLQLIGEYSCGRLLLDGPVRRKFLDHPVHPIFELGSNIEKETTGDNTFPKPTASRGTGLIFLVSFVVSCFAILVANYAPIAFLGTAVAIGSIVLALIKYRDWMKLPIIRSEEVAIEI
ncbi:unnamed protein product [Sphagnum jensenii]|uniref:Protein kinase domain-containing protein n=1 Tax=Sphagnum jensenii TaxID=128206 RepID=A0ABP0WJ83_9BRYO